MRKENRIHHNKGIVKNICKYSKKTIMCIVLILIFTVVVQSLRIKTNEDYVPSILGHTYLNVLTESMNPEFYSNDLIIGGKVKDTSKLNIGDVITFRQGNMLVTHRIVEIIDNGNSFITKGDYNKTNDEMKVRSNLVISKYKFKIPKAGFLISKMQDFQFLALSWLILMYYILRSIFKEVKLLKIKKENAQ